MMQCEAPLTRVAAAAYEIPTDAPEADGTLEWDRTVLVVVEIEAGGQTGLGYTYADGSIIRLIEGKLGSVISGHSAFEIAAANKAHGAAFVISAAAGWWQPRSRQSMRHFGI
jgi:hypothetical protein